MSKGVDSGPTAKLVGDGDLSDFIDGGSWVLSCSWDDPDAKFGVLNGSLNPKSIDRGGRVDTAGLRARL
jgi:hypothetical protein